MEVIYIVTLDKINDKQELFCQHFVETLNPKQSAIMAGYAKAHGARNTGWRLLKNPKIKRRIHQLQRKENVDILDFISYRELVNYHMSVLKAELSDYLRFDGKNVVLKNSDDCDCKALKSISQGKDGIKLELVDKKQSIEFVSRLLDKDNLDDIVDFEKLEDLRKYLSGLLKKSCKISDITIRNQLGISGKIIDCFKVEQDDRLQELEKLVNKIIENGEKN